MSRDTTGSPASPAGRPQESGVPWTGEAMEWRQPHARRSEWELVAGERHVGSLRIRGVFREESEAEGPSGLWRFRGGWNGYTEIALEGATTPAARYEQKWGGGAIHSLATGLRFHWGRHGFFSPRYVLATESDTPCLVVRPSAGLTRFGAAVTVEPAGLRLREIEALTMLAWRVVLADNKAGAV